MTENKVDVIMNPALIQGLIGVAMTENMVAVIMNPALVQGLIGVAMTETKVAVIMNPALIQAHRQVADAIGDDVLHLQRL